MRDAYPKGGHNSGAIIKSEKKEEKTKENTYDETYQKMGELKIIMSKSRSDTSFSLF